MATSSVIKLCGFVLCYIILQATRISALECYGCFSEPECNTENIPDKFLVTEASSNGSLGDWTDGVKEILLAYEFKFTKQPYCVKWLQFLGGDIFRSIMTEGPQANDLDESGCIGNELGRFCFCDEDKCNNGPIFQGNKNSALQCYSCVLGAVEALSKYDREECLEDNPPAEFLMNQTTALSFPAFQQFSENYLASIIMFGEIRMRPGPFCVKMSSKENGKEVVFRHIIPEAPEASSLDESGCMEEEGVRICFCNQDKCNGKPLKCYGCIVGADKELSEYNREACLEENPPDSLVVNATGSTPSFDRFLDGLTNYTVNSSETTKGPFCVKVSHEEERFMFRYIVTEGPDAKYLDGEGCMGIDNGRRICFCQEEKCNSGC